MSFKLTAPSIHRKNKTETISKKKKKKRRAKWYIQTNQNVCMEVDILSQIGPLIEDFD